MFIPHSHSCFSWFWLWHSSCSQPPHPLSSFLSYVFHPIFWPVSAAEQPPIHRSLKPLSISVFDSEQNVWAMGSLMSSHPHISQNKMCEPCNHLCSCTLLSLCPCALMSSCSCVLMSSCPHALAPWHSHTVTAWLHCSTPWALLRCVHTCPTIVPSRPHTLTSRTLAFLSPHASRPSFFVSLHSHIPVFLCHRTLVSFSCVMFFMLHYL